MFDTNIIDAGFLGYSSSLSSRSGVRHSGSTERESESKLNQHFLKYGAEGFWRLKRVTLTATDEVVFHIAVAHLEEKKKAENRKKRENITSQEWISESLSYATVLQVRLQH